MKTFRKIIDIILIICWGLSSLGMILFALVPLKITIMYVIVSIFVILFFTKDFIEAVNSDKNKKRSNTYESTYSWNKRRS